MNRNAEVLSQVMAVTHTGQRRLARISGLDEASIGQFLRGEIDFTDEQIDRLLSCMGCRLEVTRRVTFPELTRSEHRSWLLHRELAELLTGGTLIHWRRTILANIERLRNGVRGQPHVANLERWQDVVEESDITGLRHALKGLDRQAIEMREVTPMAGLLPEGDRLRALRNVDDVQ